MMGKPNEAKHRKAKAVPWRLAQREASRLRGGGGWPQLMASAPHFSSDLQEFQDKKTRATEQKAKTGGTSLPQDPTQSAYLSTNGPPTTSTGQPTTETELLAHGETNDQGRCMVVAGRQGWAWCGLVWCGVGKVSQLALASSKASRRLQLETLPGPIGTSKEGHAKEKKSFCAKTVVSHPGRGPTRVPRGTEAGEREGSEP